MFLSHNLILLYHYNGEKIVGTIYEKRIAKNKSNKGLELKKQEKEKMKNYMLNAKGTIILLSNGLIKKTQHKWVTIFLNQNLEEQM